VIVCTSLIRRGEKAAVSAMGVYERREIKKIDMVGGEAGEGVVCFASEDARQDSACQLAGHLSAFSPTPPQRS
jgi:hypothetical protein